MFIRASLVPVQPGTIDAVMELSKQLATLTTGLAGLQAYYLMRASDTEVFAIGVWGSEAEEQAAGEQVRGALMQQLGRYIAGRPQNWAGEARAIGQS